MARPRIASLSLEQPRSLSEQVAEKLKNAIVEGRFSFGENISEEKLAAAFGVSRTPVRDALNALQFTGLVEVRPKRGSYVFSPTAEEIRHLWQFREILEREACRLALETDAAALIGDLTAVHEQMLPERDALDGSAFARLDVAFHRCFFDHCGNTYLVESYNLAAARIATIINRSVRISGFDRRRSHEEHQMMIESLKAGDLARFDAVLKAHLKGTLDAVTGNLVGA